MLSVSFVIITLSLSCQLTRSHFLITATCIHLAIDHRAAKARLLSMTNSFVALRSRILIFGRRLIDLQLQSLSYQSKYHFKDSSSSNRGAASASPFSFGDPY